MKKTSLHSFIDFDFCVGFNDENIGCVKFGLITDDTDLEELIGLVYSVGKEIEESSKVSQSNILPCYHFSKSISYLVDLIF